jgi:hypothetical protein
MTPVCRKPLSACENMEQGLAVFFLVVVANPDLQLGAVRAAGPHDQRGRTKNSFGKTGFRTSEKQQARKENWEWKRPPHRGVQYGENTPIAKGFGKLAGT